MTQSTGNLASSAALQGAQAPDASRSAEVEKELEAYEKRADDLEKLLSLLVALTALYGIALAVNAYQQAQDLTGKIRNLESDTKQEVDNFTHRLESRIYTRFPVFGDMDIRIREIVSRLMRQLPVADWSEDNFVMLSEANKQQILFYEKTVAALECYDLEHIKRDVSKIYQGLGNYYSQKYGTELKVKAALPEDLSRALFYLGRAIDADPKNVGALNDRGYVSLEIEKSLSEARKCFEQSLRLDQAQQRARYNLALVEHREQHYAESEKLLSEALNLRVWQDGEASALHHASMHYNRACARSRLAEAGNAARLLGAWDDLDQAFSSHEAKVENFLKEWLKADTASGEDLAYLAQTPPYDQKVKVLNNRLHLP